MADFEQVALFSDSARVLIARKALPARETRPNRMVEVNAPSG